MIDGFPHQPEDSFFHHALTQLRRETPQNITSSMFTLGGFPITRVPKHLPAKCLVFHPDIVVVQFAATDLVVPLRRKRHRDGTTSAAFHGRSVKPATLSARLRWQVQGLVGDVMKLEPVTPVDNYLETMKGIIRTLLEHKIRTVVVSPFVFGGRRSDRNARHCAGQLKAFVATQPGAVFVDAYAALDREPRHRMLLADGGHLSLAGQQVVAEVLLPELRSIVLAKATEKSAANMSAHGAERPVCQTASNY